MVRRKGFRGQTLVQEAISEGEIAVHREDCEVDRYLDILALTTFPVGYACLRRHYRSQSQPLHRTHLSRIHGTARKHESELPTLTYHVRLR